MRWRNFTLLHTPFFHLLPLRCPQESIQEASCGVPNRSEVPVMGDGICCCNDASSLMRRHIGGVASFSVVAVDANTRVLLAGGGDGSGLGEGGGVKPSCSSGGCTESCEALCDM
jgi:hypothetical protein